MIYSVYYKPTDYIYPSGYLKIFDTSDNLPRLTNKIVELRGNDSIAPLNKSFGEFTAHYYVWKNRQSSVVGFCHYRRYFNFIRNNRMSASKILIEPTPTSINFISDNAQRDLALKIIEHADIISPRETLENTTVAEQFILNHNKEIWDVYLSVLKNMAPDWIVDTIPWYDQSYSLRYYPIFITRWHIFNEICEILFPILFEVYRLIGELPQEENRRFSIHRYPAYLGERFYMHYIYAKKLRVFGAQQIIFESSAM